MVLKQYGYTPRSECDQKEKNKIVSGLDQIYGRLFSNTLERSWRRVFKHGTLDWAGGFKHAH